MSAAAAPRFSRLGLKGDGVVLPLTAKEVRRRSTIRVSPSASLVSLASSSSHPDTRRGKDADARSARSLKSQTSLRSLARSFQGAAAAAARAGELVPQPPEPPFRREASASTASIASSVGSADSDVPETPSLSLSRASSESGASVEKDVPRTPQDGCVDELGVIREGKSKMGGEGGVELRVNDVTVEIIGMREEKVRTGRTRRAGSVELTVEVKEQELLSKVEEKKRTPERKGTIKRVWKKLTGSVKG